MFFVNLAKLTIKLVQSYKKKSNKTVLTLCMVLALSNTLTLFKVLTLVNVLVLFKALTLFNMLTSNVLILVNTYSKIYYNQQGKIESKSIATD